jgi:outer membrane receptor protein involved in Fe transport
MTADQPPNVEVVVVRAANLPPSPADGAFSIIRLDPAALRATPRLDEALSEIPGVSLFRRTSSLGANPTSQGVALRGIAGSGASRALVTLDGVPQNDPFGGWVIWTRLPTQDIGAATAVRGAGAGPYGAGALTGVVALQEIAPSTGAWTLDAEGGSLGYGGGAATANVGVGPGALLLSAAGEHSDGWIPVVAGRGPADQRLTLDDHSVSLRYLVDAGAVTEAWRASLYEEDRGSGLVGAQSRSRGASASVTLARAPTTDLLGWRAQTWLLASDLFNTSVSVAANRQSASLSNNQYETPALGYGANGAVRALWGRATFEVGVDLRGTSGEDRETFKPVAGVLTQNRRAGGQTFTAGAYAEATELSGPLLLTAGVRVDGWETFDGHRIENRISTGAVLLDQHPGDRGGEFPSGRLGARLDVGAGQWLRAAAYTGFRAPTLNELFRPFRVGNNVTQANSALTPERLYGVEAGAGGGMTRASWAVTGFFNRLDNPVTNVTVARGPYIDPVEGLIPAGGLLLRRENVGRVDAYGVEAEAAAHRVARLDLSAAASWTHARVDGGSAAPQDTGKIPTETPAVSATVGAGWNAFAALTLRADLRYEGARFDDDLNTLRLGPATTIDLRAEWRVRRRLTLFVQAANLFDVAVQTGETANGVYSYGPPRMVLAGVSISGGGGR